jgi:hypothetical protein
VACESRNVATGLSDLSWCISTTKSPSSLDVESPVDAVEPLVHGVEAQPRRHLARARSSVFSTWSKRRSRRSAGLSTQTDS